MDRSKINLVPATFTPMTADHKINLDVIPAYGEYLVKRGISTIFVNGSTGECMSLTVSERKLLLEAWIKQRASEGISTIIVHVGAESIEDCKEFARHAAAVGADGVSIVTPTYFKPRTIGSLVEVCSEVAKAAGALPFYYYHIPGVTGLQFRMEDFLNAAKAEIPTLAGIKFSSLDLMDANICRAMDDERFHIFYGCDEQSLAARCMGIRSFIGSTYNFMPEVYIKMHESFDAGKHTEASALMLRAQSVVNVYFKLMGKYYVGALKSLMKEAGFDVGPPRLPLTEVKQDDLEELRRLLRENYCLELMSK